VALAEALETTTAIASFIKTDALSFRRTYGDVSATGRKILRIQKAAGIHRRENI